MQMRRSFTIRGRVRRPKYLERDDQADGQIDVEDGVSPPQEIWRDGEAGWISGVKRGVSALSEDGLAERSFSPSSQTFLSEGVVLTAGGPGKQKMQKKNANPAGRSSVIKRINRYA